MSLKISLFRQEVIEEKKHSYFGTVYINTPVQYWVITAGACVMVVWLALFLAFAEFSETITVPGYINSIEGLVRICARKPGVLTKIFVKQGDMVKKGDKLFLIDTRYDIDQKVLKQLNNRKKIIESNLKDKQEDMSRFKKLLSHQYVSLVEYHQQKKEISALQEARALIKTEILQYQQEQFYILRAPSSGTVTSVLIGKGQMIQGEQVLTRLIPKNSELMAQLLVPMAKARFLRHQDTLQIQYDAYPYQRFGHYKARVRRISTLPVVDKDELNWFQTGEPHYKVWAQLDKKFVSFYGAVRPLEYGMSLTAVIKGPKKKVWQWIFDPIYSVYGKLWT